MIFRATPLLSVVLATIMLFELVLAGSQMLLGKKVMSWQVLLPRKNTKGTWGRYGLYGTLPEAFLVSGNYQICRKRIFVSYEWKQIFLSS
jgi:hypothetical protein